MEAGQVAEANALGLSGTDRVLVILVEFAGTDVFTWTAPITPTDFTTGSQWDPLGRADPNEAVVDADGNVVVGDCSKIITQTKTFTYSGPLHNKIPRPLSEADRSGQSIWTEDFNNGWFNAFMFGNGVKFQYTRQDGSVVNEDFTGKSVKQYFQDMSGGQYSITGDVIGWLKLSHSTWWYGADKCPGNRSGMSSGSGADGGIPGAGGNRSMVRDALNAVNAISNTIAGFDWKKYDQNGDGIIDRLWIVHAGYGEEDGADLLNRTDYGEAANWSHSGGVTPPYQVAPGVAAGPYIMMPENGGIGVFAHESAHNLGASDLYAYGNGDTSTGFWALQADDWTGYPIGFEPPAADPWHLDNWGWLNPKTIVDPNQIYNVTVGQASNFPGGDGVYRGVKIALPNGAAPLPVQPWQGSYYWWGGKADLANGMMTTKNPIAVTGGPTATLSFDLAYGIETEWDFMWVQASMDGGATWNTLTNTKTSCIHDPGWIGGQYGFPDDLCGAGLGGFTGYNAAFPAPEAQEFDLTSYLGQSILLRFWYMTDWGTTYEGPFVDNVKVVAGPTTLFADDAEGGDAKWTYAAPWQRSSGRQTFTHNFYLQWRNVSKTGGYDESLGDARWRFGPANTGLLVWYNNNFYNDNEIFNYLTDFPGYGPKGKMLVVDSHPEPYRYPDLVAQGYDNEAANLTSRGQMRDAPYSLNASVPFTYTDPYGWANVPTPKPYGYPGRPAVSVFHDAFGYYPGAEFVPGGPVGQTSARWMTKQWDASTVVPAKQSYGVKAPGYNGTDRFRFGCSTNAAGQVLCYSYPSGLGYAGGTGNPAEVGGDYGWRVQILSQTAMTATLQIWNAHYYGAYAPDKTEAKSNETLTYSYQLTANAGSALSIFACAALDPAKVAYVAGSATNGAVALTQPCDAVSSRLRTGQSLNAVSVSAADPVVAVGWVGYVPNGASASFAFDVMPKILGTINGMDVRIYRDGSPWATLPAPPVHIKGAYNTYFPMFFR
jgi:immune inhibitor A